LVKKEFHIFNKKVSKSEFEAFARRAMGQGLEDVGTRAGMTRSVEEIRLKIPHRDFIQKSEDCVGNHIENSQRCYWTFDAVRSRDCDYCFNAYEIIDSVDCCFTKIELGYECLGGGWNFNCDFCLFLANCLDCQFCFQCQECKNCFGCDGLHHKQYCILNKPCGSKEEYDVKVAEIWKELKSLPEAGNLMSVFEDEEFEGIEH